MRWVTTSLDVVGLLLVAAGIAAAAWPLIGAAALAIAGAVVLGGSWLTDRQLAAAAAAAPGVGEELGLSPVPAPEPVWPPRSIADRPGGWRR